jgi:23S rRNA (uridine2552-2'-O)-methyltransferase
MAIRTTKTRVKTARKRRSGSTRWLQRQLNDPFVQKARQEGYRSRAAYKLLEIDEKAQLLCSGRRVIDLGAAPGGWVQVALAKQCRVVGIDLLPIPPIVGATLLEGDIFAPETSARLLEALGGPAELLLSDLAAAATGQRAVDRLRAENLAEAVLDMLPELLAPGGDLLMKLVRGADTEIAGLARRTFESAKLLRPEATRRESSEVYLLAKGYKGPVTDPADPSD